MQFMRIAGEEAVGIYMTAYPAFIFFISLIQLGLPIAVAKIVAELLAKKQTRKHFRCYAYGHSLVVYWYDCFYATRCTHYTLHFFYTFT